MNRVENAILLSIQPQWIQKILNGEKTIEIRKTKPNCQLPIKVYIYCTKKKNIYSWGDSLNGKVVGEFILNEITNLRKLDRYKATGLILYKGAMNMREYNSYKGRYAWHIDNLITYDKPKELNEFRKQNKCYKNDFQLTENGVDANPCWECCPIFDLGECDCRCSKIDRAPQNYMFVEELKD